MATARTRSRIGLVAVVSVLAVPLVALTASAAPTEVTISGCYAKANGQLRVVDGGDACRSGEVAISWNQRGPQGEPGPVGPQGPVGPAGPQGPAGSVSSTQFVQAYDFVGANDTHRRLQAVAWCPVAAKVLSGGFETDGHVDVDKSYPGDVAGIQQGWLVAASAGAGSASLRVHAVCA